jgi:peroxiredoxin
MARLSPERFLFRRISSKTLDKPRLSTIRTDDNPVPILRRNEMTIKVGDKLPEATFKTMTEDGAKDITTADIFAGKKVVLFAVPGAFTPTCSNNHLPGYLENHDAIIAKGVDRIAVVAVNDHHVMGAWARFTGGEGKILYLADGNGDFIRSLGLETDLSKGGLGLRSQRFSMIVEDGTVKALNIEDSPGKAVTSGAATLMEQL